MLISRESVGGGCMLSRAVRRARGGRSPRGRAMSPARLQRATDRRSGCRRQQLARRDRRRMFTAGQLERDRAAAARLTPGIV